MSDSRRLLEEVRDALGESAPTLLCRVESRRIWIAAAICLGGTLVLGLFSEGCYHDDDLTHFLMARWAWWYPSYLLHIWGRPGLTVPLAAVSWIGDRFFGWHMARVLSSMVTAAGAVVAARLAMRLGVRRGWLVVIACYVQPLNSLLSFTTLTENWTALYLIGAVALLFQRKPIAASCVFSLALVTRHEAVVFIPIWWLALWTGSGRARSVLVGAIGSLWAPVVHNLLFWIVFEEWPVRMYFQPHGSTEFLSMGPLSYVPHALYAIPPVIFALALVGSRGWFGRDRWILIAIPGLFFLLHAVIKAAGVFASGGYGRFMVAVAPFMGILAARGVDRLSTVDWRRGYWAMLLGVLLMGWLATEIEIAAARSSVGSSTSLWGLRSAAGLVSVWCLVHAGFSAHTLTRKGVGTAGVTCSFVLISAQFFMIVRPLGLREDQWKCREVADEIRKEGRSKGPLFVIHPWIVYQLGLVEHPRAHKGPRLLASMPVGTVVVWDSKYTPSDFHGIDVATLYMPPYRIVKQFEDSQTGRGLVIGMSEKTADAPVPILRDMSYPIDLISKSEPISGIFYVHDE
ncbi:MAG: hypothetical protein AABZ08_11895 [Planctomycetota bacterium]